MTKIDLQTYLGAALFGAAGVVVMWMAMASASGIYFIPHWWQYALPFGIAIGTQVLAAVWKPLLTAMLAAIAAVGCIAVWLVAKVVQVFWSPFQKVLNKRRDKRFLRDIENLVKG